MTKEQHKIPVSKIQRATRFVGTGAKIGANYIKYYAKKAVDPNTTKESLDKDNAADIYDTLSELKGSALKVAQVLSMDQGIMPKAYTDKFAMAQYSAPPLSYPLVVKTFRELLGKAPNEIYESFSPKAVNAASIGQVHKATLKGKTLAVKVQYPGVADSVKSDLKIVKPFALKILNVKASDVEIYFQEVEEKLLEETDYELEIAQSIELSEACKDIEGLTFPKYYPELSSKRILTMDWITGLPLGEYVKKPIDPAVRNKLGQAIWDFYHHQIHNLKKVHADPHPGNFIITPDNLVGVIDFGCVKIIPLDFYEKYFRLLREDVQQSPEEMEKLFYDLQFILPKDSDKEKKMFIKLFKELTDLLSQPFRTDTFDFSDKKYFEKIYLLSEKFSKDPELKKSNQARGNRHGLYVNRTYFGLYQILHSLGAKVDTSKNVAEIAL
jgi:predicted unusual protein kinase regulating ubiquinone biosynthesis (AarF/ABC1/UbiB family)